MDNVIYRDLCKEDYERIKELIYKAFGFDEFIQDRKYLDTISTAYLQSCILSSSYSKVAEKDNKIIGIILGKAEGDKNRLVKFHNILSYASSGFKLIMCNKENRKIFKEFSKVHKTYNEIIEGKNKNFQGAINLFIVSDESRGLGVGKTLVHHVFDYMKSMDVKSLYLYTDNRCNYGFYDSQNFRRLNEKEIYFDSLQSKLDVFLYSYDFN
ncbi:GNAT family N-acetyltransferase [Terrisporobacter mayombei]|uniref:N-acetyltransferase domain-containing protein n=1 Tax=Terrisporobacter mayombei TaxID=1541 RepID=A0ABY9Q5U8_9FIRM|nr:GNAT family N-acetyltransferase [Terrisporobacter mayombei]MCC3868902.1 GNAT family N-acetyltransferase [Terrisporobacter mayombei]WMT82964.1 hypothetical protein TEMA_34620 [Terrisporobacter mayombei]